MAWKPAIRAAYQALPWEPEDWNADIDVQSNDQSHEVSEENKDSIRTWTTGHSILARNLAVVSLFPDNLSKAEFKSSGIKCLAGKILTAAQHSDRGMVAARGTWLDL